MISPTLNSVFDRMLSHAMSEHTDMIPASTGPRARLQLWVPPVDIYETESAFVVEADLPGVPRENVDIQFDRHTLTISGTRGATLPTSDKSQLRVFSAERLTGSFSRSVRLPEHVDAEKIDARFANGVLVVQVPKSARSLPRKIAIANDGS